MPQPDQTQPAVALDHGGPMPLVGLGTWQMTGGRCRAAVRAARQVGYRHIDTATIYRNEREVGRALVSTGYSPFENTDLGHPVLAEIAAGHGSRPRRWWSAGTSTTRWW
jgi:diketogulonate reductase-like aldo/keto reductase